MSMTAIESCHCKYAPKQGAIGYIDTNQEAPYYLDLNSFVNCYDSSSNLFCGGVSNLANINATGNTASATYQVYAYGCIYFQHNNYPIKFSYSTVYKCTSSCSIIYYYQCYELATLLKINFIENNNNGYGMVYAQECKSVSIEECIFQENHHGKSEIFITDKDNILSVIDTVVDSTKTKGKLAITNWEQKSTEPIPMTLYATGNIAAQISYKSPDSTPVETPFETPFTTSMETPVVTAAS